MGFKISDKVVCIEDFNNVHWNNGNDRNLPNIRPVKDEYYTVSEVRRSHIVISEIVGSIGWDSTSFRKIERSNFTNELTAELANDVSKKKHDLIEKEILITEEV